MAKYFLVLMENTRSGDEMLEVLQRSEIRDIPSRGLKKKKVIPLAPPHIAEDNRQLLEAMFDFANAASNYGDTPVENMLYQLLNIARKM